MTTKATAHNVFLKYAEDSEIEILSQMHPQKTMVKSFKLSMILYKQDRVNDNKHHRVVKRSLDMLADNPKAQAIIDVFIERATKATEAKDEPQEAELTSLADTVNGDAASTDTTPAKTADTAKVITKKVIFSDGSIVEAVRKIIPHAELQEYDVAPGNRRNKKALTTASVADILPGIRAKGITEETYTYVSKDNKKVIAEGSRRFFAANIAGADVPTWEFVEPLTLAQGEELSRESDQGKRLHSLRENALSLETICIENELTSMPQLLKHFKLSNTDANRTSYRRAMSAATISIDLLSLFHDYEGLSLRRFNELESIQKNALPEEVKNKIRQLKRDLNTPEIRGIIEPAMKERLAEVDEHFAYLASPTNVCRRLADTVVSFCKSDEAIVNHEKLIAAIEEHRKPKCDYDPKGLQIKLRQAVVDVMYSYLEIDPEAEEPQMIEAASLKPTSTLDEFMFLCEQNITNITNAYNDDLFKIIKRVVPLKKTPSPDKNNTKNDTETLFTNGVSEIKLSQVTDNKGKVDLSFSLSGVTEAQKNEFIAMATEHFSSKLQVTENS